MSCDIMSTLKYAFYFKGFYNTFQTNTSIVVKVKQSSRMVKLVGVLGGCEDKTSGDSGRECLARRQFPLVIESDLTMVMALDERCLACGDQNHGHSGHRDTDKETFLRNYRR